MTMLLQSGSLPVLVTRVVPSATSWRNGGGSYVAVPALIDGNKAVSACDFYSLSYRDLRVTFSEPIDFLDLTANNVDSSVAILVAYNGIRLSDDARSLFNAGPLTVRWPVARAAAQARFWADGSHSSFKFYDVCGWRKS